jgi:hypothetical protein
LNRGYIKLYRCIQDNNHYFSEPFTKIQAWTDLLLLAAYKDKPIVIKNQTFELHRSQLCWSEVKLAARWQWSREKVRRFLNTLETSQQIIQEKNNITSWITIVNYELYQGDDTANDTAERQLTIQQKDSRQDSRQDTNKEVKNIKNIKEVKKEDNPADFISALKSNIAYQGINIDIQLAKMDAWLLTPKGKGRKKTHKFILNWLNKCDGEVITAKPISQSDQDKLDQINRQIAIDEAKRLQDEKDLLKII